MVWTLDFVPIRKRLKATSHGGIKDNGVLPTLSQPFMFEVCKLKARCIKKCFLLFGMEVNGRWTFLKF